MRARSSPRNLDAELIQLGVRDAKRPAADRRHPSSGGMAERAAKGIAANHSRGAHDDKTLLACRRIHDRGRSSIQSTWSLRSANNHAPSVFTKVS